MADYTLKSTFYRPSLDGCNGKIVQNNFDWVVCPRLTFGGSLPIADLYESYDRLIFVSSTINITLTYPPIAANATTSQSNPRFLYVAMVSLSGSADEKWNKVKTLIDANPDHNCLVYYNNNAYIGSQYRQRTTNYDLVTIPSNKKLVQFVCDPNKKYRRVFRSNFASSYSQSDLLITKITNATKHESLLIMNDYNQVWLDSGDYLLEQLYSENITTTINGNNENVITCDVNRLQLNVAVDTDYSKPKTVNFSNVGLG